MASDPGNVSVLHKKCYLIVVAEPDSLADGVRRPTDLHRNSAFFSSSGFSAKFCRIF